MLGLMASSKLCVVPSREEPYGIIVVEAQSLGAPVVACAVGNIPMLVDHGITGFLAQPTPESLSAALIEAWDSSSLLQIAQRARESAAANRSYDTMTSELEGWFAVATGRDR
jgi:glycosyltransferase involved in cell wall biosynthesis